MATDLTLIWCNDYTGSVCPKINVIVRQHYNEPSFFITTLSEHLDENEYILSVDNPSTLRLCIEQCGLKWGNVIKATMTSVVDNERRSCSHQ